MIKLKRPTNILISITVLAVVGVSLLHVAFGDTVDGISMVATASTYTAGQTVSVQLSEDSGTTPVSGADVIVNIDYPYADISSLAITAAGNGGFTSLTSPIITNVNASNTTVELPEITTTPLTGSQPISTLTFIASAAGTADLTYTSSSQVNATASPYPNIITSMTGTDLTIAAASPSNSGGTTSSGGGTTTSSGGTTTTTTKAPLPATPTPSASSVKSTSVNVTPTSGSTVSVPDGSTTQVSQPVNVQPTTDQTEGVSSVQYYLDGKLVATETKAPYTYHLDTTTLENGHHTLVTITHYSNGTSKSSSQHLLVSDGYTKQSTWQDWLLPPLVIVIIALVIYFYLRVLRFHMDRFMNTPPVAMGGIGNITVGGPHSVMQPPTPNSNPTPLPPATNSDDPAAHLANIHPEIPPPSSVIKPDQKSDKE